MTDSDFQGIAMEFARQAGEAGEVPIGAVVVQNGAVIGRGRNRMEELQDATAHAEMFALREASISLGSWRLDGCQLFATLEPCPMCAGAILHSRIGRVVYGAPDKRLGACRTHWAILERNPIGREIEVVDGVLSEQSAELLRTFFRELREGTRARSADRRMGDRGTIA
jgi:tRNA(adenine34) deaminase